MIILTPIVFKTGTNATKFVFNVSNETGGKVNCYDMIHFTNNNFYIHYCKVLFIIYKIMFKKEKSVQF